jgi:LmbE family N-acetylglucosaminyl deacetylase
VAAADTGYDPAANQAPHRVSKLYYLVETEENLAAYQEAFGELVMQIDGQARRAVSWKPWAITARIDTADYWQQVWDAISCHRSQLPGYNALMDLPQSQRQDLWASQAFYRAYSLVNGGRSTEQDLFAGLR